MMIERAREPTTTYGVDLLRPDSEEPITTGRSGKMQGARTVNIPAMNETTSNTILLYSREEGGECGRARPLRYLVT